MIFINDEWVFFFVPFMKSNQIKVLFKVFLMKA